MEGDSSTGRNHGQVAAAKPNLPPGYRFIPMDYELCFHLHNKISNGPILIEEIKDVDLYKNHPKTLSEMYPPLGEKEWYFFTSRNRKYPNGSRPDRTVGGGYWKATGADKSVYHDGKIVGVKKTLVFYSGRHQESIKTNWIMHEFRIINSDQSRPSKRDANDMKLDDWVLCRIHEKGASKLKGGNQAEDRQVEESTTPNLQLEEVIDARLQVVDNNQQGDPPAAAVLVNCDKVAIASISSAPLQVNHGDLAAFMIPEFFDEELSAFMDFDDNALPSLEDVLNAPDWAFVPTSANLSHTVSEQQGLCLDQGVFQQQQGSFPVVADDRNLQQQGGSFPVVEDHRNLQQQGGSFPVMEDHPILQQQGGSFTVMEGHRILQQQGGSFPFMEDDRILDQQGGALNHGDFHHHHHHPERSLVLNQGNFYNHGSFHQQAPAYYMPSNPDYNQLMPRKRRC